MSNVLILGAGISGISCGYKSNFKIFESKEYVGGISTSYYISSDNRKYFYKKNDNCYEFGLCGGRWIWGTDLKVFNFINSLSSSKTYKRNIAVYFSEMDRYVPYPIQNHLLYLPEIKQKALNEILNSNNDKTSNSFADWLEINFGKTLCELFFFPFHQLYTSGLYVKIAPCDQFKIPLNKELILKGAYEKTPSVGYNKTFIYPEKGLDNLTQKLAEKCKIVFNKKVIKIDLKKKYVIFADGDSERYEKIISTLPLNELIRITDLTDLLEEELPYTSVLVVNIGAKKGSKCPPYHWIYIPKSKSGFYRVGFYSNVDPLIFLPLSARKSNDIVSLYVEKAYPGHKKPSIEQIKNSIDNIVKELQEWKFINEIEVIDFNFIHVAYTYKYRDSLEIEKALRHLKNNNIYSIGRYGKWKTQGIAESIKEGLEVSNLLL